MPFGACWPLDSPAIEGHKFLYIVQVSKFAPNGFETASNKSSQDFPKQYYCRLVPLTFSLCLWFPRFLNLLISVIMDMKLIVV